MPFYFSGGGGSGCSGALLPTTSKPKGHHHLRSKGLSSPAASRRRGPHSASSTSRRVLYIAAAAFVALFLVAFFHLGFPSFRPAALVPVSPAGRPSAATRRRRRRPLLPWPRGSAARRTSTSRPRTCTTGSSSWTWTAARGSRGGRSRTRAMSGTPRSSRSSLRPIPTTTPAGSSPSRSTTSASRDTSLTPSSTPSPRIHAGNSYGRRCHTWRGGGAMLLGRSRRRSLSLCTDGQLEIVSGGWVMNDEANSHYFAIIEQMMEGNMWLNDTIGVVPKNSWSIDPFGYSATMAYLLRRMGFHNIYESCPWRHDPVETNPDNVQERAMKLLDQYRKKSTLYRTNTLLIPLGDDFRYVSTEEAEAQFRNYEKLFDYINSNPHLKAEVKFGTLEDYFSTLRDEAERINYTRSGELVSSELPGFPTLSGDFFTYADRNQDYWSGYYVSRPFFKAVDRVLEQTFRASEILSSFVLGYCQRLQCAKLPISFTHKLTAARRNLALFQHHHGRMHTSLQDLQLFMSRAVEVLLGDIHDRSDPTLLLHFESVQERSKYDVQPVYKALNPHEGKAHSVVLFNPLEQTRDEIVMAVVSNPDVSVLNSNGSCLKSQISPEWQYVNGEKVSTGQHRLYWRASVPALGLETYYVATGYEDCEKATPAVIKRVTHHKDGKHSEIDEEIGMYSSHGSGAYLFKPTGEAHPIVEEGGYFILSEGPLVQEAHSLPKTQWHRSLSLRFHHAEAVEPRFAMLLQRRGWDASYCKRGGLHCTTIGEEPVNLFYMFKDLAVLDVKATSLNLLHDDPEMLGYLEQFGDVAQEGNVLISPMDIQAYKLDLQPPSSQEE
ncbi:hypothetical protein GUJ93_ZPchr0006g42703 [Zizania palustris]|uniref:mannosyl-oligosaccharide 1,3-1,6-alpha-mannosidase n=1 Tax=Zizania palustris TaxID=103762 RepID=A0A8J5T9V7_ZIZPA|nr:hypothetical protein GUJ93_ZPchr0006g42703 [Zizania palustris]